MSSLERPSPTIKKVVTQFVASKILPDN
jgi:hypothetical protein